MYRAYSPIAAALCLVLPVAVNAADEQQTDLRSSLDQLRSLGKLIASFRRSHDQQLPRSLEELVSIEKAPKSLLVDPLATDKDKATYQFLLPGENGSRNLNPARTQLIRSQYKLTDGTAPVLFADGHLELVR